MKPSIAGVGIVLLIIPILRHASFERRAADVETEAEVVGVLASIPGGLMQGFVGLMILGFLCDGGRGFKPLWLLTIMGVLGVIWIIVYPSGWLLGTPLILYAGEKCFRIVRLQRKGANKRMERNG